MSTRLSNLDKDRSLKQLHELLNNVCSFVDLPVKDRTSMVGMWNNKFPADFVKSLSILAAYGVNHHGAGTDNIRWSTVLEGRVVTARINSDDLTPMDYSKSLKGELQSFIYLRDPWGKSVYRHVVWANHKTTTRAATIEITPEYMAECLGASEAQAMIEWMLTCAGMFDQLKAAARTLDDIFKMAKTAGQIKRMVPDLLQYLPEKQREAFEDQKRSSTVPFEWAPYDKTKIGDMLLQISKGHLLSNLNRPRSNNHIGNLENQTFARFCNWATPVP